METALKMLAIKHVGMRDLMPDAAVCTKIKVKIFQVAFLYFLDS